MAAPAPAAANGAAAQDADAPIQADNFSGSGSDSTYGGEDAASYTTSLRSSILDYKTENNRRYHAYKEGSYLFPNDDTELERLDMMHEMHKIVRGDRPFTAPIKDPKRILDLGCGTGIWAIEVGDLFPEAEIVATDLSPTQPSMVPPNVKFEIDDMEQPWTFSQPFSFIHASFLAGAITDHKGIYKQAFEHLEPGGYCESLDYNILVLSDDGSVKPGDLIDKWVRDVYKGIEMFGRPGNPGELIEGWMKEAGFVNVTHFKKKAPIGPWPKDKTLKRIGAWNLVSVLEGIEAYSLRIFTQVLGWTLEETQILLAQVKMDFQNPNIHSYNTIHVITGQKPFDSKPVSIAGASVSESTKAAEHDTGTTSSAKAEAATSVSDASKGPAPAA